MANDTIQVLGGENKLLAYVDLCGISEFYEKQPLSRELAKKIGYGFLGTLKEVIDHDRMAIHILSDSALLVPKEKLPENQSPMDAKDIVKLCILLFKKLVENSQTGVPPNLSRIFITRGSYAYIEYQTGEQVWNYTIGGSALAKCDKANKEEKLPFGVFTDCSDIQTIWPSPYGNLLIIEVVYLNLNTRDLNIF